MFAEHRCYDEMEKLLLSRDEYKPFPTAEERAAWEAVPEHVREVLIYQGEERLSYLWPALTATRYMDFFRDGNRSRYEQMYFDRRQALAQLVIAECLEGSGRFIEQIINGIWCICEESYWVIPAHMILSHESQGDSLPDVADQVIDLFAGETAGLLAWTCYLLGSKLDQQSPRIRQRLRSEIKRRILDPFLERDDFWWMGFTAEYPLNNWNPWVNSNCIVAFLIFEEDEKRRVQALRKILRSLDLFIAIFHSDGGCDEGPGYWSRAGGSLFDCLELLYGATDGAVNFYDQSLIQDIGRYIYRAHISGRYFVNFADGNALLNIPAELIARYGRRIGDPQMFAMGASSIRKKDITDDTTSSLFRTIQFVLNFRQLEDAELTPPFVRDVWLDGIQFMAAREQEGSDRGLFLTAKGGHNDESHNHNDVGQFMVYVDGKPFLIDVGVETYTAKTFSPNRYEIWTMQSGYHNLPTFEGIEQQAGKQFAATGVCYEVNDAAAEISMNIAGAYPESAAIHDWIRTCRLERSGEARIKINDRFRLSSIASEMMLSLMTPYEPRWQEGSLILEHDPSLRLHIGYDINQLSAAAERISITDKQLQRVWGDTLYRIILKPLSPLKEGEWNLTIQRD